MSREDELDEGGEPACYAALVCPECGAIMDDDHRHDVNETTDATQREDVDTRGDRHNSDSS